MANQRERDEPDRSAPETEDDPRGLEDEDLEDEDESDKNDLEDEEQYNADERVTGEVGSEGGSPGETVATRRRTEEVRGSEATETWSPEQADTNTVDRIGEEGQPLKRTP